MDEETQIIKDYLESLPEDIKRVVISDGWTERVNLIAQKHGLEKESYRPLSDEVLFVVIGIKGAKDFIPNLKKELSVSDNLAQEIAVDVNENIFKSIRKSIKSLQEESGEEDRPKEASNSQGNSREKTNYPGLTTEHDLNLKNMAPPKEKAVTPPTNLPSRDTNHQKEADAVSIDTSQKPISQKNSSEGDFTPKDKEDMGSSDYHPGTVIDDKLSKIVKLPEHTG